MLHFLLTRFAMPSRRRANVVRNPAARHDAILAAACEAAAEGGMAAVQIAPVAARAGIATGTVYRYFPSKTELVAALVAALCEREVAALEGAAKAAPGPLSALAAAISTFAARALERRRLAFALMAEPVEPEIDGARASYRQALIGEFEKLIRKALDAGRLPDQDAALAAPALLGALVEGLIGSPAPPAPVAPAHGGARGPMVTLICLPAPAAIRSPGRGLGSPTGDPPPEPPA